MKHRVCCIGRPGGWAKEAGDEFAKRIGRFGTLDCVFVKEGAHAEREMLEQREGWWSICLDAKGEALSTEGWRKEWERLERAGRTKLVWLIGGAEGHSEKVQSSCDEIRSMGPQTLSHDLAWVVLLEQIYRLESWRAGHPYHRA